MNTPQYCYWNEKSQMLEIWFYKNGLSTIQYFRLLNMNVLPKRKCVDNKHINQLFKQHGHSGNGIECVLHEVESENMILPWVISLPTRLVNFEAEVNHIRTEILQKDTIPDKCFPNRCGLENHH